MVEHASIYGLPDSQLTFGFAKDMRQNSTIPYHKLRENDSYSYIIAYILNAPALPFPFNLYSIHLTSPGSLHL